MLRKARHRLFWETLFIPIRNGWRDEFQESFANLRYESWPILDNGVPKVVPRQEPDYARSSLEDVGKQRDLEVLKKLWRR